MKYVVANWKQNKTYDDALSWCGDFVRPDEDVDLTKVTSIICPPTLFVEGMWTILALYKVALGVQDISPFSDGAHTGFVGVNQVRKFCKYALVGHSERQEPRSLIMQKAEMCLKAFITPIICFKSSDEYEVVDGAIYALEDPENISKDGQYHPKNLQDVVYMVDKAKKFFGSKSVVIYGGSVNGGNAQELASIENLDGVLVGNASLNPREFTDIVRKFSL